MISAAPSPGDVPARFDDLPDEADTEQIAAEVVVSGNSIFINGRRFPWFVRENPQVIPLDSEMVALQVAIIANRVTIQSNMGES